MSVWEDYKRSVMNNPQTNDDEEERKRREAQTKGIWEQYKQSVMDVNTDDFKRNRVAQGADYSSRGMADNAPTYAASFSRYQDAVNSLNQPAQPSPAQPQDRLAELEKIKAGDVVRGGSKATQDYFNSLSKEAQDAALEWQQAQSEGNLDAASIAEGKLRAAVNGDEQAYIDALGAARNINKRNNDVKKGKSFLNDQETLEYSQLKMDSLNADEKKVFEKIAAGQAQNFEAKSSITENWEANPLDPRKAFATGKVIANGIQGTQQIKEGKKELKALGWSDDKIKEYLEYSSRLTNKAETDKANEQFAIDPNASTGQKIWQSIKNSAYDLEQVVPRGLMSAVSNVDRGSLGRDVYSGFNYASNSTEEAQKQVLNNAITDAHPIGQRAYQISMSVAESAELVAIGSAVGSAAATSALAKGATKVAAEKSASMVANLVTLPMFGLSAYDSGYKDAKSRGLSEEQAQLFGVASGLAEAATEVFSMDHIWEAFKRSKIGKEIGNNIIIDGLAQMGIEGTEELASNILNRFSDWAIAGKDGKDQMSIDTREIMDAKPGMSEEEARKLAYKYWWDDNWRSFIDGTISGGFFGGAIVASNVHNARAVGKNLEAVRAENAEKVRQGDQSAQAYVNNPLRLYEDYARDITEEDKARKTEIKELADKYDKKGKLSLSDRANAAQSIAVAAQDKAIDDFAQQVTKGDIPEEFRSERTNVTADDVRSKMQSAANDGNLEALMDAYNEGRNAMSAAAREEAESLINEATIKGQMESKGISEDQFNAAKVSTEEAYRMGVSGEKAEGLSTRAQLAYNEGAKQAVANRTESFNKKADTIDNDVARAAYQENLKEGDNIHQYNRAWDRFFTAGSTGVSFEDALNNKDNGFIREVFDDNTLRNIHEAGVEYTQTVEGKKAKENLNKMLGVKAGSGSFSDIRDKKARKVDNTDYSIFKALAAYTNLDIVLADNASFEDFKKGENARIETKESKVFINADASVAQGFHEVLGEWTEFYNSEGYNVVRDSLVKAASDVLGAKAYTNIIKQYKQAYGEAEVDNADIEMSGEFANDLMVDMMYTEKGRNALANALAENTDVQKATDIIGRIKELFTKLVDSIKSILDNSNLETQQRLMLEKGYKELESNVDALMDALSKARENALNAQNEKAGEDAFKVNYSLTVDDVNPLSEDLAENAAARGEIVISSNDDLSRAVQKSLDDPNLKMVYHLALLPDETKKRLAREVEGVNFKNGNYSVAFTSDSVRHLREHFNNAQKIEKAILAMYEAVIDYDIAALDESETHKSRLFIGKEMSDHDYLAVEIASRKKRALIMESFYPINDNTTKKSKIQNLANLYKEELASQAVSLFKEIISNRGQKARAEMEIKSNFSLSVDTNGAELSEGQREYFKDAKTVDADGKLKVFYHGSDAYGFDVFDIKKAKSSGLYGRGFYFSDSDSHAGQYGQTYKVYLNITNPVMPGTNNITKDQLLKFVNELANDEDYGIENYGYGATPKSVVDSIWGADDYSMLQDLNATCVGDFVGAVKLFNKVNGTNYDGIQAPTETIAFYANQIKDVNNKKPTNNPNIHFSLNLDSATASEALAFDEKGKLVLENAEALSSSDWKKITKAFNLLGYGFDNQDQAKEAFTRLSQNRPYVFNDDQAEAIRKLYNIPKNESDNAKKELTDKQKAEYVKKAEKHFGITRKFDLAGYLTTNGTLLDFSEGQRYRVQDHREISEILDLPEDAGYSDGLIEFMNQGNIRLQSYGIDIAQLPNEKQRRVLRDFFNRLDGEVTVDFSSYQGASLGSVEYADGTASSRILKDIESFFETGVVPEGTAGGLSTFYSLGVDAEAEGGWIDFDDIMSEDDFLNSLGQEQTSILEKGMEALKGKSVDTQKLRGMAIRLRNEVGSSYEVKKFEDMLTKAFAYMQTQQHVNYEDMMSILRDIAKPVVEAATTLEGEQEYKDFVNEFKPYTIKLNAEQKQEVISAFGSYGQFKNAMMPIKISENGTSLDSLWSEISDINPTLIPADTNPNDQALVLHDALAAMRPTPVNDYGGNINEVAGDLAMRIVEEYVGGEQGKKMAEANKKYKAELRKRYNERLKEARKKTVDETKARLEARNRKAAERARESAAIKDRKKAIQSNASKLIKWINNPTEKNHVPVNMVMPITNFLGALDFVAPTIVRNADGTWSTKIVKGIGDNNKRIYETIVGSSYSEVLSKYKESLLEGNGTKTAKAWMDKMKDIRNLYEKASLNQSDNDNYDNDNVIANLDASLYEQFKDLLGRNEGVADVNHLSSKDLNILNNMLRNIMSAVNKGNKANSINAEIPDLGRDTIKNAEGKAVPDRLAAADAVHKFMNISNLTPITFMSQLGDAGKKLYWSLRDGMNTRTWDIKKASDYMLDAKKNLNINDKEIQNWTGKKATVYEFSVTGGTVRMTTGQIMALYETLKREGAKDRTIGGIQVDNIFRRKYEKTIRQDKTYHLSEGDVKNIFAALTDEQKKLADKMQWYLANECSKQGNDVSNRLYGYEKYLDPTYFPYSVDKDTIDTRDSNEKTDSFFAIERSGFAHTLQEGANNPLVIKDIFDIFTNHVVDMASYHGYAAANKDMLRWLNYKEKSVNENGIDINSVEVKKAINRIVGDSNGVDYVKKLLKDINKMEKSASDVGVLEKLVGLQKSSSVAGNGSVVAQQPTAYIRAMALISPKYLYSVNVLKAAEYSKKANELNATALWKSWGYYETMIGKSMKQVIVGQDDTLEWLKEISMMPASLADDLTWGCLYQAVEKEQKDLLKGKGLSEEQFRKAVNDRFDEVVDKTQVVDSTLHRSQIMRNNNFLDKAATAFMAEPTKNYNLLVMTGRDYSVNKDKKALVFGVVAWLFSQVAASAMKSIITALRYDDDDKRWADVYKEQFFANTLDNLILLNILPVFKDFTPAIQSIINGDKYSPSNNQMSTEALTSTVNLIQEVLKSIRGESNKTEYGLYMMGAKTVSLLTGLPVYNVTRDVMAVVNQFGDDVRTNIKKSADYKNSVITLVDREDDIDEIRKRITKALNAGISVSDIETNILSEYKDDYLLAESEENQEAIDDVLRKVGAAYDAMFLDFEPNDAIKEWTKEKSYKLDALGKAINSGENIKRAMIVAKDKRNNDEILSYIVKEFGSSVEYERKTGADTGYEDRVNEALTSINGTYNYDKAKELVEKAEKEAKAKKEADAANAQVKADLFKAIDSSDGQGVTVNVRNMMNSGKDASDIKSDISTEYHKRWKEASPSERNAIKNKCITAQNIVNKVAQVKNPKDPSKVWESWEKDQK